MYTFRRRIFYLSYYHSRLKEKNNLINKNEKGTQLCYDLFDFKKVITMTSLALRAFNQHTIQYTVSNKFIDEHENNKET